MATATDKDGVIIQETDDVSNAVIAPIYAQITVTTTAQSLQALLAAVGVAIPARASLGVLTPESFATIAIRWRADGTSPTANVGEPVFGDTKDPCLLGYNALVNASLISATGGNVTVDVRIGG